MAENLAFKGKQEQAGRNSQAQKKLLGGGDHPVQLMGQAEAQEGAHQVVQGYLAGNNW